MEPFNSFCRTTPREIHILENLARPAEKTERRTVEFLLAEKQTSSHVQITLIPPFRLPSFPADFSIVKKIKLHWNGSFVDIVEGSKHVHTSELPGWHENIGNSLESLYAYQTGQFQTWSI